MVLIQFGSLTDHGYGSLIASLVRGVETIISVNELVSILGGEVNVLVVSLKEGEGSCGCYSIHPL